MPTASDVHRDADLSNIAIGYKNPDKNYIADLIFPQIETDKMSDYYYIWTKDFFFRNQVNLRAPGGVYPAGGLAVSDTQFVTKNWSLSYLMPREVQANADAALDLERVGAEWLADQFALNREILASTTLFITGVWGTTTSLTGVEQWDDYANSTPIENFQTAIETVEAATGMTPNTAVLGVQAFNKLRRHPDLIDLFKYTTKGILSTEQVAEAVGIEKIVVGRAMRNTAAESVAFAGSYIWGKSCLICYVPPSPGIFVPMSGATFVWKNQGLTLTIDRIAVDQQKSDALQGDQQFVHQCVGSDLGYMYLTVVS